jgi:ABC-type multidrug transport system fused ATPase/permease subunit
MLLEIFLLSTLLFDIAETRTWWLVARNNHSRLNFAYVLTATVATKVVIMLFEAVPKSRWIHWSAKDHSPEETMGIWGLAVYAWLNRLFGQGYREVLTVSNLYPLDAEMRARVVYPKLEKQLDTLRYKGKKLGLARALIRALAVPLLLPMAPRLALLAFTYSQPFFVEALLDHLQAPEDGTKRSKGYGLIGAAILIYCGIAISDSLHQYFIRRALCMARGCLCSAVYRKTTQAKTTADDDKVALTLMSTDVEKIVSGFVTLHDWWASVIAVALGCWLLQHQIGIAFVAPVITVAVCAGITSFVSTFVAKRQAAWMALIQKRVGITASSIANMKGYKISGLVEPVVKTIQALRMSEIYAGNRFREITMLSAVLAHAPQTLAPLFTFAATSKILDTTTVYTAMSYILLLTNPLIFLLQSISTVLAAFTCMARIQKFLDDDPRRDFRKFVSSFDEDRKDTEPSEKKSRDYPSVEVALHISNGQFGYSRDKMVLKDINLSIPAGALTMIVGPVASGKTTLCKALLGEISIAEGEVVVSGFPKCIAYCDQTPFLLNATLLENIIGHEAFDQSRYDAVVTACQLEADVALFPNGHETRIGSNGIMLSGGQKQRVSLARALYLPGCPLLIFDDILSGLDNDTATVVYRRVFGPSGLIPQRGSTAVLCTHSVRRVPTADHIIALSDGRIVEEGSFSDLMKNASYVRSLGVRSRESDAPFQSSNSEMVEKKAPIPSRPTTEALSNTLDKTRQTGDWKTYRLYFSLINPFLTAVTLTVGALYGLGDNFGNIWLGFWTEDRYSRDKPFYLGIYALLKCTQLLSIGFVVFIIRVTVVTAVGGKLHKAALNTVATAPLKFFTSTDSGVVTNLFSQDLALVDGELQIAKVNLALMLFDMVGMAAVIASASPYLVAGYPGLVLVLYLIQKFYLRTSRQMRLLNLEAKSPL